jgi:hypothetical protein
MPWHATTSILAMTLSAMVAIASPARALEANEAAIKAAYLFKFSFFVEWPNTAFPASDTPISLCIVGKDPFGATLDDNVKGQKIGDRAIIVRRLAAVARESGCHIVYVAAGAGTSADGALAALRGSDVLTVTDAQAGGAEVGIINFVVRDSRVRFDIDDAAAASAGLTISSRLLGLAVQVKPRP